MGVVGADAVAGVFGEIGDYNLRLKIPSPNLGNSILRPKKRNKTKSRNEL